MNWICQYCGNDTSTVDYDYLVNGTDHLVCALTKVIHGDKVKKKVMKIKNFDKISGFTYKGFSIVNPMHNADETKYFATILNLNNPRKPKWELSVITSEHKWLIGDSANPDRFIVILQDDEGYSVTMEVHKERMKSISIFRNTFEEMIDQLLAKRLTSAGVTYSSHSFNAVATGIVNVVNSSGASIVYNNGNPILK